MRSDLRWDQETVASEFYKQHLNAAPREVRVRGTIFYSAEKANMEDSSSKQMPENLDDPPNSRLFVITSRRVTEDEIRENFSDFGEIQGVWLVKDKQTKESKGVAYVKYAKSSQACLAMEEMHGKVLLEGTKPIKVESTGVSQ